MQKEYSGTEEQINFKDKIKVLYNKYKFLIFSLLLILLIILVSSGVYFKLKEKKRVELSNLYVQAKIYLTNEKKSEAKNILIKIINSNDTTYSPLSLFLIINTNLIQKDEELIKLFENILTNNKFETDIRNLIIFKKSLIQSNITNEEKLLESLRPLMNSKTIWKSQALLLLGDYFFSKKEFLKAKENYQKILSLEDADHLYEHAKYRLALKVYD